LIVGLNQTAMCSIFCHYQESLEACEDWLGALAFIRQELKPRTVQGTSNKFSHFILINYMLR
jgi:hypothetical protein